MRYDVIQHLFLKADQPCIGDPAALAIEAAQQLVAAGKKIRRLSIGVDDLPQRRRQAPRSNLSVQQASLLQIISACRRAERNGTVPVFIFLFKYFS